MALDSALKNSSTIPPGFEDLRGRVFQERYAISEVMTGSAHRVVLVGSEAEGGRPIVLVQVRPAMLHDGATLARFERRVRASTRVRHPGIGVPIDSGEALDGKLWLVYERPDGEPLDVALGAIGSGRLSWAEARPLLLELVQGLAAAHARKVVHGSVSPSSCWVHGVGTDAPALRLLELGANADPAGDETDLSYSRTTTVGGDPVFMAPESAGGSFGDERSDAYQLGLVAWFMLVGRPPFQAGNAFQVVTMHLQAPVPAMREAGAEVPAAVEAWVRALLAKEPGQRPASMTEIEQGILAIDELGEPRKVGAEELDKPRGRRGRAKAAAARDEAVQRLGASDAAGAGQGLGRRLPGQEIVDPRAVVPSPGAGGRPAGVGGSVGASLPTRSEAAFVAPGPSSVPPAAFVAAGPSAPPAAFVAPAGVASPSLPKQPEPAFVAPSVPSPSSVAAAGVASREDLERTLAFMGTDRATRPAVPAHEEPAGTVMLSAPRAEPRAGAQPEATPRAGAQPEATPRAGAQPEATMMLGHDAAAAGPPDATMMLSGAELAGGGALQPGTMVLGGEPRRGGPDPTATMALTANPSVLAGAPGRGPEQAPTMLLAGGDATDGHGATAVLGFDALGFEQRDPAPAPRGVQPGPASRMAPPVDAPVPQAPPPQYAPPAGPPVRYAPPPEPSAPQQPIGSVVQPEARSQLWMWVVILTLVAAVAGVVVGLVLGG